MKRWTAVSSILLIAVALPATAGRHRASASPADSLSIAFVETESGKASLTSAGTDAWLDIDTIGDHNRTKNQRSTRIHKRFGVRVDRAGATALGTVIITAHLESWDGRAVYRLDGRSLSTTPIVVQTGAPPGAVIVHTLDIEIPFDVPEGPLSTLIQWEVRSE